MDAVSIVVGWFCGALMVAAVMGGVLIAVMAKEGKL